MTSMLPISMMLVEAQVAPRSMRSSRSRAQEQTMRQRSMWMQRNEAAAAWTTFLPTQRAWQTARASWSRSRRRFLSSMMQQLCVGACAKAKRILPPWKQACTRRQVRPSHTLRCLSSETLTMRPLPSTSMLRMQPSCPSSVRALAKEERSQRRMRQASNCPRLEASVRAPSRRASWRWQLRTPSRLPKTRCTCGCSPRISHILMAESSLPENSRNCPSCSSARISDSCAWIDLYWKSCSKNSCPSIAPRNRLPRALSAAVMLFFGQMAVVAGSAASRLIWSMLGMWTWRWWREPAMREAMRCFCLILMMNFSCSISFGGARCHSSTRLSSTCRTFYRQLAHVTSVCARKPSSSSSNAPIFALISPSSCPAFTRSLPSESRHALATLQSGSGRRRKRSWQYSLSEVWTEATSWGDAVAQAKQRISLEFMIRKRQFGCSNLHCGQAIGSKLNFFSACSLSITIISANPHLFSRPVITLAEAIPFIHELSLL